MRGRFFLHGIAVAVGLAAASLARAGEPDSRSRAELRAELDRLHREAVLSYRHGDIEGARAEWARMLELKPDEKRALTYLDETRAEHEKLQAKTQGDEAAAGRARAVHEALSAPVTISTDRPVPLAEFMRIVSFSTPTELQYSIAGGVDAEVTANFADRPLRDVLDSVLKPIGLVWRVDERGALEIKPELATRAFRLTIDQTAKARALLESGDLQRAAWGRPEPPVPGASLQLDERTGTLAAAGSKESLRRLEDMLQSLKVARPPDVETRMYKIREDDAPKIKALLSALGASGKGSPAALESSVHIGGGDLILRDTPENLARAEDLLLDKTFIANVRNEKLAIANFSLVPREVEGTQNSDQIQVFTTRVVEALETFLYAREGKRAALAEGRRLFFDPSTLQLTVVDSPENIAQVGRFIESLPELRQKRLQKVMKLDYAVAETLASDLVQILGAEEPSGGSKDKEVVKRLRRGDQILFKDLKVRLIRVQPGDPNDRNDDECELQLNTGTQVSNLTIRNLDTQYFDNYEITAESVRAAGGSGSGAVGGAAGGAANSGEGTVRLKIRYVEPVTGPGGK